HVLKRPHDAPDRMAGGKSYNAHITSLRWPTMVMPLLGQPARLLPARGLLSSLCVPTMSATLLSILNTDRVPREWRNGPFVNLMMALCTLAFAALAINELYTRISNFF